MEQSIEHYHLALQVKTSEVFPYGYIKLSINLADIYLIKQSFSAVRSIYHTVEEVGEDILALTTEDEEQAKSLELFQKAFSHHDYALAKLKKYQAAFNALEKGKTRGLSPSTFVSKNKNGITAS